jgi:hypothetical protein
MAEQHTKMLEQNTQLTREVAQLCKELHDALIERPPLQGEPVS